MKLAFMYMKKKPIFAYMVCLIICLVSILINLAWIACGVYICISLYFAFLNNEKTIIAFLVFSLFQNIILIVFSDFLSPVYNNIFSILKEFMLYLALIIGIINYLKKEHISGVLRKHKQLVLILSLLLTIVIYNILFSDASFISILVVLRQLEIPFTGFFVGYFLFIKKDDIRKIEKCVIYISLFLSIVGIIEMLLPDNFIWNVLDYGDYLRNKQNGTIVLYKGVTSNFYTWDLGFLMRRLVSITADPLATAHLIFIGLAIMIFSNNSLKEKKNIKKIIEFSVLLLGCILGFSKGTIVYLMISFAAFLYNAYGHKIPNKYLLSIVIALFTLCTGVITALYVNADKPTAITNHIDGLLTGLGSARIFGNGIGTSGAVNSAITGAAIINSESYFGVMLNQIGIIGIILLCFLWVKLIINFIKYYITHKSMKNMLPIVLVLGLSIDMLLSESSVSVTGTGIYFILLGIIYKFYTFKENIYEQKYIDFCDKAMESGR